MGPNMSRLVSVVVNSYNFEQTISHTISTVTSQTLASEIEIIFHDDASTDSTFNIAESLVRETGIPFIPILRRNNRMSRRIPVWADVLERINSKYVAILDGDDFWINQGKLEAQVAVLERFREIDICFSRAQIFDGTRFAGVAAKHGTAVTHFPLAKVIEGDGSFMPTSSILIRSEVLLAAPDWFFSFWPLGDFQIQVLGSRKGGALYLPFDLVAYRTGDPNSFTGRTFNNSRTEADFRLEFVSLLVKMANHFDRELKPSFLGLIRSNLVRMAQIGEFGILARGALEASRFSDS